MLVRNLCPTTCCMDILPFLKEQDDKDVWQMCDRFDEPSVSDLFDGALGRGGGLRWKELPYIDSL